MFIVDVFILVSFALIRHEDDFMLDNCTACCRMVEMLVF